MSSCPFYYVIFSIYTMNEELFLRESCNCGSNSISPSLLYTMSSTAGQILAKCHIRKLILCHLQHVVYIEKYDNAF